MIIRQAVSTDGLLLSSLCMDVQRLHADHYPYIFKRPQREDFAQAFFEEVLAEPTAKIFILEKDTQALGCIVCRLIERQESPFTVAMRYLHIDQISVRPEARGQGVGAALIRQAELSAKEWRVQRIQLDSWDFNINAHRFFERMGFQKFVFRFWREL